MDEKNIAHPQVNQRDAHGFSIFQVISLAREMTGFPKVVTLYGIEPLELGFGDRLSPEIKRALPVLVEEIDREIKRLTINLVTNTHPGHLNK